MFSGRFELIQRKHTEDYEIYNFIILSFKEEKKKRSFLEGCFKKTNEIFIKRTSLATMICQNLKILWINYLSKNLN